MDVAEDGGIRPGYKLKLNSYDLGVDIELHDALERIRFEHPEIRSVVFSSAKNRIFCSGANIYMLGLSSHAWKVNFCKFTNETRIGIEDASRYSGLKFLAACNGTTAGGGYELALACDEIILVDDRSSAVSLPELPLLGVLPGTGEQTVETALEAGAHWWPLQMARELDDAILSLRTNELELGLWVMKTAGSPEAVLAIDKLLLSRQDNWFVREVLGRMRRTFARLEVASRSLYAIAEPGSCFAGSLLELALAADRIYMRDSEESASGTTITLSEMNFGPLPMANHLSRLAARFCEDQAHIAWLRGQIAKKLSPREALEAGLVTAAPDDLDWEDEIRQAMESRAAQSPDALTGLEANLRFGPKETPETRIFGRLSAWQHWIFIRPNAVGPSGALKVYGTGAPVKFDWEKV